MVRLQRFYVVRYKNFLVEINIERLGGKDRYETNRIINSSDINKYLKDNSLLIITDVNKSHLIQNENIIHNFKQIIVIDHHQLLLFV